MDRFLLIENEIPKKFIPIALDVYCFLILHCCFFFWLYFFVVDFLFVVF